MSQKTLSQLRDADFMKNLKASLKRFHDRSERPSGSQIIADALKSRPERYYFSYRTVESHIRRMRKNRFDPVHSRLTAARSEWVEIHAAVDRYLARHKKAPISEAIDYVVNFARPSRFFISDRKARQLFNQTITKKFHYVTY